MIAGHRWLKQTTFYDASDVANPNKGNCAEAAAASLLGVPLPSKFGASGAIEEYWEDFEAFFARHGFWLLLKDGNYRPDGLYLASGPSNRGCSHMVVMRDGKLVHDPHPSDEGIHGVNHVWVPVPIDPLVGPLAGKYSDVLHPFMLAMEAELHANVGKGDRAGWLKMRPETALLEIYYHLGKLQKAVKDDNGPGIREFSADVANMAMMLLDICGGLAQITPISQSSICVWHQQSADSEMFTTSCRHEYQVIDADPGVMCYCPFCGRPAEFQMAPLASDNANACAQAGCSQTDGEPCTFAKCPQRGAQG